MAATFSAGGLASGLDTNTLIDALVKVRALSVDRLKIKQGAYTTQVSVMGDVVARLGGLKTAAAGLGTGGVLGVTVQGSLTGLSATSSSAAQAGSYAVQVTALAAAAKQRSAGFTGASPPVTAGSLDFSVNGTATSVALTAGMSLSDVASAINSNVSGVSATVLSDGTASYLSVTNRDTGFAIGGSPSTALQISGSAAGQFGFTEKVPAANAHLTVDGLDFERKSNTMTDVLPGVTFTASALGASQDLVLSNDTAGTSKNIQGFIEAYNLVLKSVQKQLSVSSGTDRSGTLAGDAGLRNLQSALQGLTSKVVGAGNVRTLADVGVKTARDGSLSIDSSVLEKAIARDPGGVNALFNTATTGISTLTTSLVDGYTNTTDGVLTVRTKGIQGQLSRLAGDITKEQAAVERYRDLLVAQFTAMETVVGGLKATGNYLTMQENVNKK
ncbi:MAG: flagellar filament capping protein FliD [Archangiaceae bacterium]|nr:flagellar filament capping protein FliD [Archangiaceae bacterium]